MMVTEFLQFCKLDRVFTSISSFIFRSSSARRGSEFARDFATRSRFLVVSWVDWHAGWSRLCRNQEEVHRSNLKTIPLIISLVPSRFSPLASHLITRRASAGGTGEERERQKGGAARRNNFVTCPIRRRSLVRDATRLLKPEATADLRPIAGAFARASSFFFSSFLLSPR